METLKLLPTCFLLLTTSLSDVQTEFLDFDCEKNMTAEIGKNINITCTINNKQITAMIVTFCTKTLCSNSPDINTFNGTTTAENGRIALEINGTSAILHISSVKISDQRIYQFHIWSPNGNKKKNVSVWIVGPVPSTSERTERDVLEKLRSEEVSSKEINYSIIVVPIVMVALVCVVAWWCCRKKKGAIKLYFANPPRPDGCHQPGFPEDYL